MSQHDVREKIASVDIGQAGSSMYRFVSDLYPICRSITGDGTRRTLAALKRLIPLTVHEVPSGTPVFDWTVPKEWNIRDAWVKDSRGNRVVDFQKSNLHVLNYSVPVKKKVSAKELREHLFSLPEHPCWVPYRTSYYSEQWGFCVSHNDLSCLTDAEYEIEIDASLEAGSLSYGEYCLQGQGPEEILISCHICHPSLANDNLSGVALAAHLANHLTSLPRLRYSYRFLFLPGTIGAITWLCLNEALVPRIRHGFVVACVGDPGPFTYKRSRQGQAEIDRTVEYVLRHSGREHKIVDFSPYGYDERQFCSPAFNLPVGCLSRSAHNTYPEYHTSADNLDFIRPESMAESFSMYLSVLEVLEKNRRYVNTSPKCEPNLGKRGLYALVGNSTNGEHERLALLWVLNQSDGSASLLDIAERSGLSFNDISRAARFLAANGLLVEKLE